MRRLLPGRRSNRLLHHPAHLHLDLPVDSDRDAHGVRLRLFLLDHPADAHRLRALLGAAKVYGVRIFLLPRDLSADLNRPRAFFGRHRFTMYVYSS